jgi:putative tryptophan/tyrosine transport system substrate-binding protein
MTRREFITLMGGAAAVWPLAARAQQPVPVIGFFHVRSLDDSLRQVVAGFRRGLSESGYVEGQNVSVEYRWAGGEYAKLSEIVAELVSRPVAVLVAGADAAALAAKSATSSIPIVFSVGTDPVQLGLVAAFNRPSGNATGMSNLTTTLEAKRLGLLHELVSRVANTGILMHPAAPSAEAQLRDVQEAARAMGVQVHVLWAGTDREIDGAFDSLAQKRIAAVAVTANAFFDTRRDRIIALAARHSVPAMYHFREFATAGGLMSYGIDLPDVYRQVGAYAGQILKGANPADLPVKQPTKFEFVINLKTAKALGLTFPPGLLAIADEVIE